MIYRDREYFHHDAKQSITSQLLKDRNEAKSRFMKSLNSQLESGEEDLCDDVFEELNDKCMGPKFFEANVYVDDSLVVFKRINAKMMVRKSYSSKTSSYNSHH